MRKLLREVKKNTTITGSLKISDKKTEKLHERLTAILNPFSGMGRKSITIDILSLWNDKSLSDNEVCYMLYQYGYGYSQVKQTMKNISDGVEKIIN